VSDSVVASGTPGGPAPSSSSNGTQSSSRGNASQASATTPPFRIRSSRRRLSGSVTPNVRSVAATTSGVSGGWTP
jgi:hypothetical protein